MSKQHFSEGIHWEVVLVDNNSSDNTSSIAERLFIELGIANYIVVKEPIPGLSNARKRGVAHSKFDLVLFCDDDNWLESSYLQLAYDIMEKDPSIGALGGRSEARFEAGVEVPMWFETEKNIYAVGEQGTQSGDITKRGYLWGAGLVMRKSLFLRIVNTDFPLLLGDRKEGQLTSGGDSELCFRIIILGYKLHYDTRLFYCHFIPANRLTNDYRERLHRGIRESMSVIKKYSFFIENFVNDRNRLKTKLKWYVRFCLGKLGFNTLQKTDFFYYMLTAHINYRGPHFDRDIVGMKKLFKQGLRGRTREVVID